MGFFIIFFLKKQFHFFFYWVIFNRRIISILWRHLWWSWWEGDFILLQVIRIVLIGLKYSTNQLCTQAYTDQLALRDTSVFKSTDSRRFQVNPTRCLTDVFSWNVFWRINNISRYRYLLISQGQDQSPLWGVQQTIAKWSDKNCWLPATSSEIARVHLMAPFLLVRYGSTSLGLEFPWNKHLF